MHPPSTRVTRVLDRTLTVTGWHGRVSKILMSRITSETEQQNASALLAYFPLVETSKNNTTQ